MSAAGSAPRYVVLDGSDGCGKSTQAARLTDRLRSAGLEVDHVREPGSTRFGERIREILLDPATGDLDPLSEVLAFSAARRELLHAAVAPALAAGRWVVSERCFASTWVYQCVAAGRDDLGEAFRRVTEDVHRDLRPDVLVVLDLDDDTRETRLRAAGAPDRIEARGADFQARVRRG
ncbi:MAG: dTMP kinase, partial [Planctomycetes bacterium]|nr:dTMP kinase [Planctomycetota bacterium]